jgi:hypothetical protein
MGWSEVLQADILVWGMVLVLQAEKLEYGIFSEAVG